MNSPEAGVKPALQIRRQAHHRAAARRIQGLHARPGHGHAHAQPHRFGKGLLGRETRGQIAQATHRVACLTASIDFPLLLAQDALYKAITMTSQSALDPLDTDQVGADAGNQTGRYWGHDVIRKNTAKTAWAAYQLAMIP